MASASLLMDLERAFGALESVRQTYTPKLIPREVGTITAVSTGIAKVAGLRGVGLE